MDRYSTFCRNIPRLERILFCRRIQIALLVVPFCLPSFGIVATHLQIERDCNLRFFANLGIKQLFCPYSGDGRMRRERCCSGDDLTAV